MIEYELSDWKANYQLKASYFRGLFIDVFSQLELSIDLYLIEFFMPLNTIKSGDFKNIIVDRLSFEAKRTSLKTMFEKQSILEGFIKTKKNSWPYSPLLDEIRKLQAERNYFAHYSLMVPWTPDDTIITLTEFRDSIKFIKYNKEKYDGLIKRINKAAFDINTYRDIHLIGDR